MNRARNIRRSLALVSALLLAAAGSTASAHFQLLYTPEAAINASRALPLALVFSHPFNDGYTMDMGRPEAFYVIRQRGAEAERRRTDLLEYLEPVTWSGVDSQADAFVAHPPRSVTRSLGDYTYVLRPAPYYEQQEDKYIQQITKTMINIGACPVAGMSLLACRWKSYRWTSPMRTGSEVFSARLSSPMADRFHMRRSKLST